MEWYNPKTNPPPMADRINWMGPAFLGVFKDMDSNKPYFYFVRQEVRYDGTAKYIEAGGEQYAWWSEDELIAWTSLEEVEKDFFTAMPERIFY